MKSNKSQIKSFFKNGTIFITGATGFMGKVITEKLLRECEDVKKIYVLLRPKKGKNTEQRFEEIFGLPCFEVLKSNNHTFMEKVSLIDGDCQEPALGISDDKLKILKNEVNCVIHLAANVRFDQSLKEAVYNVRATTDLLELSKLMTNLKCFVLVSTAYSNCVNPHIKEKIYDPPIDHELLLNIVNGVNEDILTRITPILIGKWPNTYAYSKCISEHLVESAAKYFPTAVIRPGIIMNSVEEPLPGWIDNIYGPIGVVVGSGLGIIRSFHAKRDVVAYIVPVDYACNCVLAAIWKTAKEKKSNTIVFNYVGFNRKLLNWGKFATITSSKYWKNVGKDMIWYNVADIKGNKLWHDICTFLMHTIPAYLIDAVLYCLGKPTIAVKGYAKIDKVLTLTSYFTTHHWHFDEDNVRNLWMEMNEDDKKMFNFSMEDLDWENYFDRCVAGMRRYITKDPPNVSLRTYVKLGFFMIAHYSVVAMFYYFIYNIVLFIWNLF